MGMVGIRGRFLLGWPIFQVLLLLALGSVAPEQWMVFADDPGFVFGALLSLFQWFSAVKVRRCKGQVVQNSGIPVWWVFSSPPYESVGCVGVFFGCVFSSTCQSGGGNLYPKNSGELTPVVTEKIWHPNWRVQCPTNRCGFL